MTRIAQRAWRSLLFVLLAVAVAPSPAGAQTPWKDPLVLAPGSDMTLYEATENMRLLGKALVGGQKSARFRKATSELLGLARRGSPLCPIVASIADPCVVNATGTSDVNLTTGLGNIVGTVTVVVQEVIEGTATPDSPEVVVKKGKFVGTIDFRPALEQGLPFGTVAALLVVDGGGVFPFNGIFRQPVDLGFGPVYLTGFSDSTPVFALVNPNEFALSFPTVRFEIAFPSQSE